MKRNLPRRRKSGQNGFTLLEVLVAILLVSVGIFGFVKMQALALSSTQVASSRSIVAVQASSLAAVMHGNRGFWGAGLAPATFSTTGATVTESTGVLTATVATCQSATAPAAPVCTRDKLAAYDVQQWANSMASLLPSYKSTTTCSTTAGVPVSCVLKVTWTEKYVSASKSTASAPTSMATGGDRVYTLYIEP